MSHAATIFELLRRYNRKSRFVTTAFGTPLGLTDSHLLIELDAHPDKGATELAISLGLHKSTVSRALEGLIAEGYFREAPDKQDRRRKYLVFTSKGQGTLRQLDIASYSALEPFVKNLTDVELSELRSYLRQLADGDNAPPVPHRAGELPILVEMRRLSRAWGVIGRSFMGSGYSTTYWQLFSELADAQVSVTPKLLADTIGLSRPTLSTALKRLERNKLLIRKGSKNDGRSHELHLSAKGLKIIEQIRSEGERRISLALGHLAEPALNRMVQLLARYASESVDASGEITPNIGIVELVSSDSERRRARGFLLEQLVRSGLQYDCPETVVGSENFTFTLRQGERLLGVCELKPKGNQQATLENFVLRVNDLQRAELFLHHSIILALEVGPLRSVTVPTHSTAAACARLWGPELIATGYKITKKLLKKH